MTSAPNRTTDARVSARSVVVDLLSTMPPRYRVAVGALVRGGVVLGIGENPVRVALARLRSRGLVESDERGLYRLSPAAQPINREVRSWRSIERATRPWNGAWLAVETSGLPRGTRNTARQRERALRILGFETLTPALRVRPDNLVGGVAAVRERLAALGHEPAPFVCGLADLDPATDAHARSLWDSRSLAAGYQELRARLVASAERLPSLCAEEAMAESFWLGGEAIRRIVLDPLLPGEIVDTRARRALVAEMRRYDRIGRRFWRSWAGESVELANTPADVGGLVAVGAAP